MTRKRRYLISVAVLAASVGIALGVLTMMPTQPGLTRANFDRIKEGMTASEVELLLGRHPDNISLPVADGPDHPAIYYHLWTKENSVYGVGVQSEKVISTSHFPPDETIPDKLRRWMNLPSPD